MNGGRMRKNAIVTIGITASWLILVAWSGRECAGQDDSGPHPVSARPELHHILIEVTDIGKSIPFYRDCLGLSLTSQSNDFATLESANAGVYLWQNHWDWEHASNSEKSRGVGIYTHFEVDDAAASVERFRKAGYAIVQEPRKYDWGTEAFVRDPDGYVIALVKATHVR
jgi:predicted enzyme related to lactoylglutathione lyase